MMGTQLQFFEGAGPDALEVATVFRNHLTWTERGLALIGLVPTGREVTGEELRAWCLACGLAAPKTYKRWGALINLARRRAIIKPVDGRMVRPADKASKGRRIQVYTR